MASTLLLWLLLLVPIAAQVPLMLYLMRHIEIEETPQRQPGDIWGQEGRQRWNEVRPDRAATASEGAVCRRCGAANEPGYRFCENCVGQL